MQQESNSVSSIQQQQLNTVSNQQQNNKLRVIIRIKPHTESYQQNNLTTNQQQPSIMNSSIMTSLLPSHQRRCILDVKDKQTILLPLQGQNHENFTFDFVGTEDITQEDIFQQVGRPIVDQCLHGYNGSIFAYGQTGSGKTHTIQGKEDDRNQRGLLPRCFEYLFQQISKIKNNHNKNSARGKLSARHSMIMMPKFDESVKDIQIDVRCSYLEIYNENIIDLLDLSGAHQKVQIRESAQKGIYPEPCTEEEVSSIKEVMEVIDKGARNRHVSSTNMNKESSRSHAVFTAIIKMIQTSDTNEQTIKTSRFHIVDLAGSERSKDTGAEGQRLKEANAINKSLSTLGTVIYELAEQADTKGRSKHIRFRDSKLTYLLKDAIGGNSQTVMICNINPHHDAHKETRQTLLFAQRAKMVKTQAVVNEENTNPYYWKERYMREIQLPRANTLPNPSTKAVNYSFNADTCPNCKGDQKGKENLQLSEAYEQIKLLTLQLKEEQSKREESELAYDAQMKLINGVKKDSEYKFQLKQQQVIRLNEKFKLIQNDQCAAADAMNEVIQEQTQEIKRLNDEHLDHLRMKQAHLQELERQLQQYRNSERETLSTVMSQVLVQLDKALSCLKTQPSEDVEMADSHQESMNQRQHFSQFDQSMLTQKRSQQDIVEQKMHYEDQLEQLREHLRKEQVKTHKLFSFIGGRGTTQNDVDLLQSQNEWLLGNTQNFLLSSQNTVNLNTTQQVQGANGNGNSQPQFDELMIMLNDAQAQITDRDRRVEFFEQQMTNLNQEHQALFEKQRDTEAMKFQLESTIKQLNQQLSELSQENDLVNEQLQQMDQMIDEVQQKQTRIQQLEDENSSLQAGYDSQSATIYTLEQQLQSIATQFEALEQDRQNLRAQCKKLQEMHSKDQQTEMLQQQLTQTQSKLQQKDQDLKSINQQLKQFYEHIDQVNEDLRQKQAMIEVMQPELAQRSQEVRELKDQMEAKRVQIEELEEILQDMEQRQEDNKMEREKMLYEHDAQVQDLSNTIKQLKGDKFQLEDQVQTQYELLEQVKQEAAIIKIQYQEERRKTQSYKDMLDQHMSKSQQAIETIQKYRSSNIDKSQQLEDQLQKVKSENKELRDKIRESAQQLQNHEQKIKNLEQLRDKLVKDDNSQKLRNMERENQSLQNQTTHYQNHAQSLESQLCLATDKIKDLQKRNEELDKQYTTLINGGDASKFQHFNQIKSVHNKTSTQLMSLNNELTTKKKDMERMEKRVQDIYQMVTEFGEKVCSIVKIHRGSIKVKCETNIREYLNSIQEIIQQACTNMKLQLETPNALGSQHSLMPSSSSSSESSYTRFNIFDNSDFCQPQHNQYLPPQLPQQQPLKHVNVNLQQCKENTNTSNSFSQSQEQLGFSMMHKRPGQAPLTTKSSQGKFQANPFIAPAPAKKLNLQFAGQKRDPSNNRMDID